MTNNKTKAELQDALDAMTAERDSAVALADKHIKRGSELQGEIQGNEEIAAESRCAVMKLYGQVTDEQARHNKLLSDSQHAIKLVAMIMGSKPVSSKPYDRQDGPNFNFADRPF